MDKNTILGILMMGAVLFGFMYLNKPSEEQIAREKQEQADRVAAQAEAARKAQEEALRIDTLSSAQIEQLKNGMRLYAIADTTTSPASYRYTTDNVDLALRGNDVTGTIKASGTTVDAALIIAGELSQLELTVAAQASKAVIAALNDLGRYKNFAAHLSGNNQTVNLEYEVLSLQLS
ncbi:MAG: hypothetical protein K2M65_04930, partial [Muribaculaceae bacterium]|nr:hypothetical protein [Muribaculaceae bacterium]